MEFPTIFFMKHAKRGWHCVRRGSRLTGPVVNTDTGLGTGKEIIVDTICFPLFPFQYCNSVLFCNFTFL